MFDTVIDNSTSQRRALTIKAFKEAYGISHTTVYKLIKEGKLRTVIVGGRRLVPVDEAEKLIALPNSETLESAA